MWIADWLLPQFGGGVASHLGQHVSASQIVLTAKRAGSTVVSYEVQPPLDQEWWSSDSMAADVVKRLQAAMQLDAAFMPTDVNKVFLPRYCQQVTPLLCPHCPYWPPRYCQSHWF